MTEQISFEAAPLDPYAERITTGIALLGGVLLMPLLFWFLSRIAVLQVIFTGILVCTAVAATLLLWLALNYAVMPVAYRVEQDQLVVRRTWWRALRVPLNQIIGVSEAGALADMPRRGLRRAFNAGVFGYHGPFQLDPHGQVFFSATNREKLVAVARQQAPPLILSPARPRDFVEALRAALAGQLGEAVPG
jgi:hypothetical protein